MESAVLTTASERTGMTVKYVEFVEVHFGGTSRKVYFCVASEGCALVKRSFSKAVAGAVFAHRHIEAFIIDTSSETELLIKLNKERLPFWATVERVQITSLQRVELVKRLTIGWRIDYMARSGRTPHPPVFKDRLPKLPNAPNADLPTVEPFIGMQEVQYENYQFFLDADFEDRATASGSSSTGQYIDQRGVEVAVHIHEPLPILNLEEIRRDSLRYVAMEYKRGFTETSKHFMVIENKPYCKKMNLSDDVASWSAWEVVVQTDQSLVCCIILRRTYIPPLMDNCQDIAVMFRIHIEDMLSERLPFHAVQRECRLAADSLSTVTQNHLWYKDLVQYKLDALLYTEESYKWLQGRLKLLPQWHRNCKIILKSVLTILKKEGILSDFDLLYEMADVPDVESPLRGVTDILQNANGFDESDDSELQLIKRNQWAMRVARYVAFCLDGGLCAGRFSLADIAACVGKVKGSSSKLLNQLLDFILHLRSKDWTKKYENGVLMQKLGDAASGFSEEVFNDNVLAIYFEVDYLAKLLPKGQEASYVQMMGLLLQSPTTSTNLKVAMCRQILRASENPSVRSEFFNGIVPSVMGLLKPSSGSYNPALAAYAIAALVNLSAGSLEVKNMLLNSGIAPVAVNQLRGKDEDTLMLVVKLSVNLTKSTTHRHRFLAAGILPVVADHLVANFDTPHAHKLPDLAVQVALLGQLANDTDARDLLLNKYPVLECVLFLFHKAPRDSDLMIKCMFCLRQLSLGGWQVRQRIGKHSIPPVVTLVRECEAGATLVAALTLLQSLASFKPNCVDMREAQFEDAASQLLARVKVDTVSDRVAALIATVNKQLRWLELESSS